MLGYALCIWVLLAITFASVFGATMSLLRKKSDKTHPTLRRLVSVLRIVGIVWASYASLLVILCIYPQDLASYVRGDHYLYVNPFPVWTIMLYAVLMMVAIGSFLSWEQWAHYHHSDLVSTTIVTTDAIIISFPILIVLYVAYVGIIIRSVRNANTPILG